MAVPANEDPFQRLKKVTSFGSYAAFLLVVILWLFPSTYTGLTHQSLFRQTHLNRLHHLANLFPKRIPNWNVYHVEIQKEVNGEWFPLPYDGFFPMDTFGHRSRIDHRLESWFLLLGEAEAAPHKEAYKETINKINHQKVEMAQWIKKRMADLHPDEPTITAVRFIGTFYDVSEEELKNPQGSWKKTDFSQLNRNRFAVGFPVVFKGRK